MPESRKLEVCCGSLLSVQRAAEGGAFRVELCSGLAEGGLTPSLGLINAAMQVDGVRRHVLSRPRPGDFLYTPDEVELMVDDIVSARRAGADGVVVGALTADGNLDTEACQRFVEAAKGDCVDFAEGDLDEAYLLPPVALTFHRAFDVCRCPLQVLEELVSLGFDRILTSGQAATAESGTDMLRTLVQAAAGRIVIMPGCGVNEGNAKAILDATGATEIHASLRAPQPSQMRFRHEGVSMGTPGNDEYATLETSVEKVRAVVGDIA